MAATTALIRAVTELPMIAITDWLNGPTPLLDAWWTPQDFVPIGCEPKHLTRRHPMSRIRAVNQLC